jgi:hypothetical protein
MLFEGLDHLSQSTNGQEGESIVTTAENYDATNGQPPQPTRLMIGPVPTSISAPKADGAPITAQQQGQEQQLRVYSSRRRENVEQGENVKQGRTIIWYRRSQRTIIWYRRIHKYKRKNILLI